MRRLIIHDVAQHGGTDRLWTKRVFDKGHVRFHNKYYNHCQSECRRMPDRATMCLQALFTSDILASDPQFICLLEPL